MKNSYIEGEAHYGKITKQLLHEIPPHAIIIIEHEDLDIIASEEMLRKKVRAVINTKKTLTGKLPRSGINLLLDNHIPVFDLCSNSHSFDKKTSIKIDNNKLYIFNHDKWEVVSSLIAYTKEMANEYLIKGMLNYPQLFLQFTKNSLYFAEKEISPFIDAVTQLPPLPQLTQKNVFVVARGVGVKEDIHALRHRLRQNDCKVLAVDGAAQLLIEQGVLPDYVIGDMDSLPIHLLSLPMKFIAHSYLDGYSPGGEKLLEYNIRCATVPFPGMSEDLAIMIAYVSNATHIYTLGCRTSAVELVEKGREGMGSTLLTRIYCGEKISDCKSIHQLFTTYANRDETSYLPMIEDAVSYSNYLKEY